MKKQHKTQRTITGKETIRFPYNGKARLENYCRSKLEAQAKINLLLEKYLGINDTELGNNNFNTNRQTLVNTVLA